MISYILQRDAAMSANTLKYQTRKSLLTGLVYRNYHHRNNADSKRFLQMVTNDDIKNPIPQWNFQFNNNAKTENNLIKLKERLKNNNNKKSNVKWSTYSLPSKETLKSFEKKYTVQEIQLRTDNPQEENTITTTTTNVNEQMKIDNLTSKKLSITDNSIKKKRTRTLKPRKALITLTPKAVVHLKALLDQPNPKMIRISTRNRGCSGLTYDFQYIDTPGKFDEIVEQDGVKVVIDSKALFSVVGSEMEWINDKLSARFVFKNPNSKGTCGCGESFMV